MERLGVMLYKLRIQIGESQGNTAAGIISTSKMCKVEVGEQQADYFTLQALFERLGKSVDKLELAISGNEYKGIALRDEIEQSFEKMDKARLDDYIKKYSTVLDTKYSIHKQYIDLLHALLCYMQQDYNSSMRWLERALHHTECDHWEKGIIERKRLCNQEIRIILLLIYCKWKQQNREERQNNDGLAAALEHMEQYLLQHYTDGEEQVKVYPQCAWLLGKVYLEQDKVQEAYMICKKGKNILIENGSLLTMRELLELEEECLERMNDEQELQKCRNYQKALAFLYEAAGERQDTDAVHIFIKSSFQGEFVLTNELLKELRKANKMTQEELCEDICSQKELSQIENGIKKPNRTKLYQMFKKLDMKRGIYYGFIVADDYVLYEKVRLCNRCFPMGKYEEAEQLLKEIESGLDLTIPVNRQFVEAVHLMLQVNKKEISREQANEQLKDLLFLTMPPIASKKLVYRVPFRTEYTILNNIAVNMRRDGKVVEALGIYRQIMQYYMRSKVKIKFHAVPGLTLFLNYAGYLEEFDDLEKAEQIAREGLYHGIRCCRGDIAGGILANLSVVYGKQGMPVLEEKYLKNGYYLVELYNQPNKKNIISIIYKKKYNKSL